MRNPRLRLALGLSILFAWIAANFFFFRMTVLTGGDLRYLLLPLLVFIIGVLFCVRFLRTAYGIENISHAAKYFAASLFGVNHPLLVVNDGKALVREDEENLVLKIGGPGLLALQAGNVALVERYDGSVRVIGPGVHVLDNLEALKETTHLDERYQPIEKISARSKDGIVVAAEDIRYRYRIVSRSETQDSAGRGPDMLFRYAPDAIVKMVYNRAQTASGLAPWEEDIRKIVESTITAFIHKHLVDYLIAPRAQPADPRAEIYQEFYSPEGQKRFSDQGAELIWIDIGHFETPEENVAQQRVNTWRAKWLGNENVMRDSADAQEMGKIEAEREILNIFLENLEAFGAPGEGATKNRPLVLARIAQLIDSLRDQPFSPDTP
jgi:hypothetical protein